MSYGAPFTDGSPLPLLLSVSLLRLPSRFALNQQGGPRGLSSSSSSSSSTTPLPPVHARMPPDICVAFVGPGRVDENRTTMRVSRIAFARSIVPGYPFLLAIIFLFFFSLLKTERERERISEVVFRVQEDGLAVRWTLVRHSQRSYTGEVAYKELGWFYEGRTMKNFTGVYSYIYFH